MSLAQKLKQLRLQAGLTQEQLAARIGVSSRTIKHWEHGTPHQTLYPCWFYPGVSMCLWTGC